VTEEIRGVALTGVPTYRNQQATIAAMMAVSAGGILRNEVTKPGEQDVRQYSE
jgi:hypothetical protein